LTSSKAFHEVRKVVDTWERFGNKRVRAKTWLVMPHIQRIGLVAQLEVLTKFSSKANKGQSMLQLFAVA